MKDSDFSVVEVAQYLLARTSFRPPLAFVLGSGLSEVGEAFEGQEFAYAEIPGMPRSTVAGHKGLLKIGPKALVFLGRFHHYEGYSFHTAAFPSFLAHRLGVSTILLTNAAGGIHASYHPGDLVLIRDHINLMGGNPLVGPHDPSFGPRFFDMTEAYSASLRTQLQNLASLLWGYRLAEGVYAGLTGPNYETPAEIRFLKTIGADLVGMSTVPEALAARSCGLTLAGLSVVTNLAAGLSAKPLNHTEVEQAGRDAQAAMAQLLTAWAASPA